MAKKIQLTIAEPCHENWENMTPVEKGRFCGSCQKQVVDFSNMSDREIAVFFKKPSTGSVCGRFMQDQLDRDMEIPKKRIPWVKYFFQFALPAFLVSLKANSQQVRMGKPAVHTTVPEPVRTIKGDTIVTPVVKLNPVTCNVPVVDSLKGFVADSRQITVEGEVVIIAGGVSRIDNKTISQIKGRILDEFGDPVPYANIIVDGKGQRVQADSDGNFIIIPSRKWKKLDLYVTSAGFIEKSQQVIKNVLGNDELIISLATRSILPEVKITSYTGWKRLDIMGAVSRGLNIKSLKKVDSDPLLVNDKHMLDVYPNPVMSGGTLNIVCKNMEEGYYVFQLLNLSGQLIRQRELWVDDKATVLNMDMAKTVAGTYLLRFTNKVSGKGFTEKIVVQ
jgi:hypothetical protein